MQPLRHDFPTLTRGDTETLVVIFKQMTLVDGEVSARFLTGYTATWTVKRPGTTDLTMTSAAGGKIVLDPVDASLTWVLSAVDTAALGLGANPYLIRLSGPDGDVSSELTGTITTRDLP